MVIRKKRDVAISELKIEQSRILELVQSVSKTRRFETKWRRCEIIRSFKSIEYNNYKSDFYSLLFHQDIK